MKQLFKRTILFALIAALAVAAMPLVSASAMGDTLTNTYDPTTPPAEKVSDERLAQVWARQLKAYDRLGKGFDRADDFITKAQELIDRASQNGKDVTALQAALDAFEASIEEALPMYESAAGIVESHEGFDDKGSVIDAEKAKETVRLMGEKLKEIRTVMDGTGQALREAIKAFRDANPRPKPTATPES
jgi:hypothetical protein